MHRRHHAQRQHIINSLDTVLYQLHALSFFLSPSLWGLSCRCVAQLQCSRPRDTDASMSLRFFFFMVMLLNLTSVWTHTTQGAVEGRAVILDFVGLAFVPSKLQLLFLDFTIIFFQLVLTTIAYENSLSNSSTTFPDTLLPIPLSPFPTSPFSEAPDDPSKPPQLAESMFIVDLRLSPIINRLKSPTPAVQEPQSDSLPLPSTSTWPLPLPTGLRMIMRARTEMRRRADNQPPDTPNAAATAGVVPGAMDSEE